MKFHFNTLSSNRLKYQKSKSERLYVIELLYFGSFYFPNHCVLWLSIFVLSESILSFWGLFLWGLWIHWKLHCFPPPPPPPPPPAHHFYRFRKNCCSQRSVRETEGEGEYSFTTKSDAQTSWGRRSHWNWYQHRWR